MKKYILTIALLLSVFSTSYTQVVAFRDSLTLSDTTNIHHMVQGRDWDFMHLTITLSDAGDTVKVYTGTNYANVPYGSNDYVQVGLVDKLTGLDVPVITGSTDKKGYFIKWGLKQRNFKLDATVNTGEITYTLEAY